MIDDLRWAVRYAFLEDLWRDRARVIVDSGLEATLRAAGSVATLADTPLGELVDSVVPRSPSARTWMAVADEAVARELAQTRPGTGFLPRASFADVVAHRDWAVAMVELSALDEHAPGGPRLRTQLAARAEEGRTVVVTARSLATDDDDDDPAYGQLVDLLEDELGGGRIFGVYRPPMAAVIDFGGDDDDQDDEVALSFDNTIGSQAPRFVEYLGIAGPVPDLPEGMSLVELPPHATPVTGDDTLRAQLLSAQRKAELAAIDRQALLEQVDELESSKARIEQQAQSLRDQLARLVTEAPEASPETNERLQAALAENQSLRWSTQQLERELAETRARPVEALEAEVATLRAQLAAAQGEGEAVAAAESSDEAAPQQQSAADEPGTEAESDAEPSAESVSEVDETSVADVEQVPLATDDDADFDDGALPDEDEAEVVVLVAEADERAHRMRRGETRRSLDRLIARVERGGIDALALRQALVQLRRRLGR